MKRLSARSSCRSAKRRCCRQRHSLVARSSHPQDTGPGTDRMQDGRRGGRPQVGGCPMGLGASPPAAVGAPSHAYPLTRRRGPESRSPRWYAAKLGEAGVLPSPRLGATDHGRPLGALFQARDLFHRTLSRIPRWRQVAEQRGGSFTTSPGRGGGSTGEGDRLVGSVSCVPSLFPLEGARIRRADPAIHACSVAGGTRALPSSVRGRPRCPEPGLPLSRVS